ncbi:MAG: amino acid permease [Smithellaceae bacterium]
MTPDGSPQRLLALREVIALIVGIVIGAGIFKAPSMVADMTGSAEVMFGAWLLGGVISLVGALCYAELASAYPHAGGDYHFLRRAYGRSAAFLFGWARFSVIVTGSIALLAFVVGDYLNEVWPLGRQGGALYAGAAVLALSWLTADTFSPDMDLVDELGIDSMDLATIALVLQDEYKILIDEDDYPKLKTVRLIGAYIEEKLATRE